MKNGKRPGSRESGQVWIEGILWISLFMTFALGFLRLSNLEYRAYENGLVDHEYRAALGSSRSR